MSIQDVMDIIQTIIALLVACTAIKGLSTWKQQVIGSKKIELAAEVLTLAYTLQAAIKWARHPAGFGGEGQERPGRGGEPEATQSVNDFYYSRISRLSMHDDNFAKMETARMRFRAYFGDNGQDALAKFNDVRNRISRAVGTLINQGHDVQNRQDFLNKLQDIILDMPTESQPDAINQELNNAIKDIERICRPIITKA